MYQKFLDAFKNLPLFSFLEYNEYRQTLLPGNVSVQLRCQDINRTTVFFPFLFFSNASEKLDVQRLAAEVSCHKTGAL